MKLSDFIARFLVEQGIDTVFGVTGGAAVHLFDSAYRANIKLIFTHHEQAAAFASQAYARIKGLGVGFFTTGPGGTNAVTGIAAAWLDSVPVIYIGGQVRSSHIKPSSIRQQGTQELDIVSILSPITKYATVLKNPHQIRYELEKCLHMATKGRPGPVYLEIPIDFQWVEVEENRLSSYLPDNIACQSMEKLRIELCFVLEKLCRAKKPLLLLGHGIRLGSLQKELEDFLHKVQIPYVTTWNATDLVEGSDPLNLGRPGMFGCRAANLAIQGCDFLCCLGSHLPISITTGDFSNFARSAEIAVINIDPNELIHQRVKVKYPLLCNVELFFKEAASFSKNFENIDEWRKKCAILKAYNNGEEVAPSNEIEAYFAIKELNKFFSPNDTIVVDGGGTIVQIAFQALKIQKGQRLLIDAGLCAMGSGLPQSVGAACLLRSGSVVCLCGDGSFQFNVQELQTIFHHKMPVKLFIFNNNGYLSIRNTQGGFLDGRYIGSSEKGGLSIPSITAVARAYNIPSIQVRHPEKMASSFQSTMVKKGPALCEIMISKNQEIKPRIGFDEKERGHFVARPIEDMYPYLPKDELAALLR